MYHAVPMILKLGIRIEWTLCWQSAADADDLTLLHADFVNTHRHTFTVCVKTQTCCQDLANNPACENNAEKNVVNPELHFYNC